jgi:hypothetical protein
MTSQKSYTSGISDTPALFSSMLWGTSDFYFLDPCVISTLLLKQEKIQESVR